MQISVSEVESDSDFPIEKRLADMSAYFITSRPITLASVKDVGKVETAILSDVYSFLSLGQRYMMFNDERDLDEESVRDSLNSIRAITELQGYLCEALDKTDGKYGISPDHDPLHDGYTYLWCCDKDRTA